MVLIDNYEVIVQAFGYVLVLFALGSVGSLLLGTLLAAMYVGPVSVLNKLAAFYVVAVRNTPLLLVLIIMRRAAPEVGISFGFVSMDLAGLRINNLFTACLIGLILYTAPFVCEALRAGINAVPLGQAEAARAIGMPFADTMRHVIMPQAVRASVPPLASVQIAMLKNTTVCGALGVTEAFVRMRGLLNNNPADRIEIFLGIAFVFVVLVSLVSFTANRLERRWRVA